MVNNIDEYNLGGILADDMGLGKHPIQLLAVIKSLKVMKIKEANIVIVCPSSLSLNWKAEIEKIFTRI